MTASDLQHVGGRHMTSKLSSIEGLERGVRTFGFRGEALHCLAAISVLEIVSRAALTPTTTTA